MALPWGFFYAGAPTVIASLWQVDDVATALLMSRFYENLLGASDEERPVNRTSYRIGQPMTKADALAAAQHWLRTLPSQDAKALVQRHRGGPAESAPVRTGVDEVYDFSHPYYWAAFILIGDPE